MVKEVTLNALPEKVFDAYTVKADLEKWFAHEATIDPSNGTWRYTWPGGMAAAGRILEAQRPNRLVWTWEKSITADAVFESNVVITYTFEATDGGTRMHVVESNHATQEAADMSAKGVDQMIGTLRAFVEDGKAVDWSEMQPR